MWPALIAMLAMSAAKAKSDQDKEARDRKYQAELIRNSPWTGMQSTAPQRADTFGTMSQGLATGLAMDQATDHQHAQNDLLNSQKAYYDRGTAGPATGGGAGGPTATAMTAQSPYEEEENSKFDQYMQTGRVGRSAPPQMSSSWSYVAPTRRYG